MKPFRFRLAVVKKLRERAEHAARENLAHALTAANAAEVCWANATMHETALVEAISTCRAAPFRAREAAAAQAALQAALRDVTAAMTHLREAQHTVAHARSQWDMRRRELEVLAKLEQRQRRRHRESDLAAEQHQLDELAHGAKSLWSAVS